MKNILALDVTPTKTETMQVRTTFCCTMIRICSFTPEHSKYRAVCDGYSSSYESNMYSLLFRLLPQVLQQNGPTAWSISSADTSLVWEDTMGTFRLFRNHAARSAKIHRFVKTECGQVFGLSCVAELSLAFVFASQFTLLRGCSGSIYILLPLAAQ